ncbi:hypothetical protein DBR42_22220 [Pelomonas sp. HMWF004]|nr:hypothetical protein DBR42_22220 [Pelomonas sp. HMWF004]
MTILELRYASINDYAMVVPLRQDDLIGHRFDTDGSPKDWADRPLVAFADSSRRKNKRPPADVSVMVPGALVLSRRAFDVLGPFLLKFGELLELECEIGAEIRYFYNVTHLVHCVDVGRSEKNSFGDIRLEVFDESNVPEHACVFKDPATADLRIYVNAAAAAFIEERSASAGLTGIECGPVEPIPG